MRIPSELRSRHTGIMDITKQAGFTLIELLTVVAILAAIAGVAAIVLTGVDERTQSSLAPVEIQNVAKAIRQFKKDTGYYPRQGPFSYYTTNANCNDYAAGDGSVDPTTADSDAWLNSPANLGQLYTQPTLCAGHPLKHLESWNESTGRGWRGPYIDKSGEAVVDIGDNLQSNGTGHPVFIDTNSINNVPGVADTFVYNQPVIKDTGYGRCSKSEYDTDDCLLEWRILRSDHVNYDFDLHWVGDRGRPYLLFFDGNNRPRLVSMGPNGEYDSAAAPDPCDPIGDDIVVCF